MFFPFAGALAVAPKALTAKRKSGSFSVIRNSRLNGQAIEMVAVLRQGVICRRWLGDGDMVIQGFAIHNRCPPWRLAIEGIGEGLVFLEDGDFSLDILAHGDPGVTQGIAGTV